MPKETKEIKPNVCKCGKTPMSLVISESCHQIACTCGQMETAETKEKAVQLWNSKSQKES